LKENESISLSLAGAKRIAYEVLLKKSCSDIVSVENVIEEIQYSSFELSLNKRKEDAQAIEKYASEVVENPNELLSISSLLFKLKNINYGRQKSVRIN
jgi:CRISPR/Cas system-associated endoribonuclease Cas2